MKTKIGYKVCDGKLSAVLDVFNLESRIKYILREFVKPKRGCGPLCVFKTLEAAKEFKTFMWRNIYVCEYVPSRHKKVWTPASWKPITKLPTSTVLASAVKLLEEIV